ncbi:hypothetical protein LIER_07633 [Lithospermum erythrorhizon]|uniref:Retrovirus-related Pol polyprotein from transposon TNT 1-94 n=1 Tax=Lithospermum erythrorhizon TaxID=34254 RepID=A0AAV3PBQ0_LITER
MSSNRMFTIVSETKNLTNEDQIGECLQQNGVDERKNRTVMNMVRSMLSAKKMPRSFWPEAVLWTFHVLNRCPILSVKNMTTQQCWNRIKPSVSHFKVWGCLTHAHVAKVHRDKLDKRSIKCIFLGIIEGTKGYRLYDVEAKKVLIKEQLDWEDVGEIDEEDAVQQPEDDQETPLSANNSDEESTEENPSQHNSQITHGRTHRAPTWMNDYVSGEGLSEDEVVNMVQDTELNDPVTYAEAFQDVKWKEAIQHEIESIKKNGTWTLAELPKGCYTQKEGIDFTEVFAPVARLDIVRMIVSLAAYKSSKMFQLDVKYAFLQGDLHEKVYVDQSPGYIHEGEEQIIYKLHKALYGLKQAPRAWFTRIEAHFLQEGFKRVTMRKLSSQKEDHMEGSSWDFDMYDLGYMSYFLIETLQKDGGIFTCQRKYAEEVLQRFGMDDCNSVTCPMQMEN